ncbi:uncharacterized protein BP5553_06577 [Venustampulla echinocandica]|uniref:Uncharacterized protein n=1 Tax=Venustampulla echinocandica TaxID=2656787 RepID=A0A370TKC3_9HELO|nr:uncharacterized protein BP5553_06577 [Venustampulla echinocandica]RDL35965.1 hypothetical protein BP5553_06577 [Venustampulla echinocandica]
MGPRRPNIATIDTIAAHHFCTAPAPITAEPFAEGHFTKSPFDLPPSHNSGRPTTPSSNQSAPTTAVLEDVEDDTLLLPVPTGFFRSQSDNKKWVVGPIYNLWYPGSIHKCGDLQDFNCGSFMNSASYLRGMTEFALASPKVCNSSNKELEPVEIAIVISVVCEA